MCPSVIDHVYVNNHLYSTKQMEPRRPYVALPHTFQRPFLDILDTTPGNMSTLAPYCVLQGNMGPKRPLSPTLSSKTFKYLVRICKGPIL